MDSWIIIGVVYLLGMFFIGTKFCCFCGDHGSDLISLFFWFIVAPYHLIKDWMVGDMRANMPRVAKNSRKVFVMGATPILSIIFEELK